MQERIDIVFNFLIATSEYIVYIMFKNTSVLDLNIDKSFKTFLGTRLRPVMSVGATQVQMWK